MRNVFLLLFCRRSSREHAPWALADYGFRVIIAPSFADIFYNNCIKNGILLISLKSAEIDELFSEIEDQHDAQLTADLKNQTIASPNGNRYNFEINSFGKECLIKGLDHIDWTLQFENKIAEYEKKLIEEKQWM